MTSKVLKSNGQVVHSSTVCALNDDETLWPGDLKEQADFDESIEERLGKPLTVDEMRDFDPDIATPEYELYEDDVDGTKDPVPDVDDVTPE